MADAQGPLTGETYLTRLWSGEPQVYEPDLACTRAPAMFTSQI